MLCIPLHHHCCCYFVGNVVPIVTTTTSNVIPYLAGPVQICPLLRWVNRIKDLQKQNQSKDIDPPGLSSPPATHMSLWGTLSSLPHTISSWLQSEINHSHVSFVISIGSTVAHTLCLFIFQEFCWRCTLNVNANIVNHLNNKTKTTKCRMQVLTSISEKVIIAPNLHSNY